MSLCFFQVAGLISLKHVYEIAKIKSEDSIYECVPMKKICEDVIRAAYQSGIKVNIYNRYFMMSKSLPKNEDHLIRNLFFQRFK